MRKPAAALLAAIALLLAHAGAGAQPRSALGGWTLDLTGYGWLPAMDGKVGAGALRADISNSFIDTVRESDSVFGFSARGELRRGRLGLFLDGMYSALGYDDVRAGPATLDATTVMGMLEFGAVYEVAGGRFGGVDRNAWALDGLGGGRWMYLRNKVFLVGVAGGSTTSDWVDPSSARGFGAASAGDGSTRSAATSVAASAARASPGRPSLRSATASRCSGSRARPSSATARSRKISTARSWSTTW